MRMVRELIVLFCVRSTVCMLYELICAALYSLHNAAYCMSYVILTDLCPMLCILNSVVPCVSLHKPIVLQGIHSSVLCVYCME